MQREESTTMRSSLEIAQTATLRPIAEIADEAGIEPEELELYGRYKAKVDLSILDRLADRPDGKIVNVTAITPTPPGEGKTTTSVSLVEGLGALGRRPVLAIREASLGPVFGIKGGAAGGGHAQVVPMEDLNLHFTGDLHAITAANNLLAAMAHKKLTSQARKQYARRRDQRRVTSGHQDEGHFVAPGASPSSEVAARDLLQEVQRRLSPDERQILELRNQGHDWAAIAARLGGGAEALRKKLARAIDRVAEQMGLDDQP